jgi:hypothetical protein
MVEIVSCDSWCGYDAAIHVIKNHTTVAVWCGCGGYLISNIAAAIANAPQFKTMFTIKGI